jgi:7-cyano-7-deazaguanine reductase
MITEEHEAALAVVSTEITTRRARLRVVANPSSTLDYLNILEGNAHRSDAQLTLRYVPDKQILAPVSFKDYLAALGSSETESLECLAVAVLEDINNEVVPRWVQIAARRTADSGNTQTILIEDRQPKWDNRSLLARLARY